MAVKLSEVLSAFVDNQLVPRQQRLGQVMDLWSRTLPAELLKHCEIVDFSRGQLKVLVDCPSYRYLLHTRSQQLLEQLQQSCPSLGIKKIRFVAGRQTQ